MRYRLTTVRPAAEASSDCRTDVFNTIEPFRAAGTDSPEPMVQDNFIALYARSAEVGRNCRVLEHG